MAVLKNEDVLWYVATRRKSGAHFVLNEYYIEQYESEFERIREFDTLEEANEALAARQDADRLLNNDKPENKRIRVSKIRGDIRKGSVEDEAMRAQIKAELMAELEAAKEEKPKTKTKPRTTGPTKEKLE